MFKVHDKDQWHDPYIVVFRSGKHGVESGDEMCGSNVAKSELGQTTWRAWKTYYGQ